MPFVTVKTEMVACPLMAAALVIFRNPTLVAPKPRKFASAVRVIANVPLVVTGEPDTENSPGVERPMLVTVPPPPVVAVMVPSAATMIVELSTLTNPSVDAVAAFVGASVFVPRKAARPLARDIPFVATVAAPAGSYSAPQGQPFVAAVAEPAAS